MPLWKLAKRNILVISVRNIENKQPLNVTLLYVLCKMEDININERESV